MALTIDEAQNLQAWALGTPLAAGHSNFRYLFTGSRDWHDAEAVRHVLAILASYQGHGQVDVVRHGDAPGLDRMVGGLAKAMGTGFWTVDPHPAKWSMGRGAGMIRNQYMVNLGVDLCLAFIRNGSRGATRCAEMARVAGIPVWVCLRDDFQAPSPIKLVPRLGIMKVVRDNDANEGGMQLW